MISQKILDALADNNWKPYIDTDNNSIDLEWYSPAGEDFLLSFDVRDDDDFLSQLYDAYMDFDSEQHAIENYGMRGAPGLRVLLDDAEAIECEIQRLWCELSKVKEMIYPAPLL